MVAMGVLSAPAALAMTIVPIIIGLYHSILQSNILENTKGLLFTSSIDLPEIRMIIDPSGYVYDLNTGKMIKNAIVSIYYFTDDENSTGIPADNDYGILWKASEWNQANPNFTAENGAYAWDVPNGWWRIKCEKEGYKTTWSEWIPVPPVQTDVNIGMISTKNSNKDITYDNSTKTIYIISNIVYSNAIVYIAAYQDDKLVSLKSQPKDIAIGDTSVVFSDFDSTGADTIKVFVWESSLNLEPLFNVCVVKLK